MDIQHRPRAGIAALILAALCATGTAGAAGGSPPAVEPVTETVFGRTLTDEYRWMEDPARVDAMKAWVLAESEATRRGLAALPVHAAFAEGLKAAGGSLARVGSVSAANDRVSAFQRFVPGDRVPRLVLRVGAVEKVLIDPNRSAGASVVAVNNHSLSPDGRHVAVHTAAGGAEVGSIRIHDVATGEPVGEPIGPVWGEFRVSWLDDLTIAYTLMAPPGQYADQMMGMTAHVRRLDGRAPPALVLGPRTQPVAVAPKDFPLVFGSAISPWVAGLGAGARSEFELMVVRRDAIGTDSTPWRRIAGLDQRVRSFAVKGNDLFLIANRDNPAGRLTRANLSNPRATLGTTLLDGSDRLILETVEATRDGVYVQAMTDGRGRLFYSAGGTARFREVPLPFEGSIIDFEAARDGRSLTFGLTGWLTNRRYLVVKQGRVAPMGLASDTWAGAAGFAVDRLEVVSRDGTQVPMVVLRPGGSAPAGGYPALLGGYGSYGSSTATPFYDRFAMAWVRQGGAMAFCGTRGGGERGRAWHDAGRGPNKPKAQDDLVACAETLKARGLARQVGPVVTGTSAGGLLAPPAALRHPEAFSGLVARVAIANATRLAAAPNGANQFDEMGDPTTAEGWAALAQQDPYLMSATAADLPDTLLTIGLNDRRVAPWMSAKFAARAQQRFGDRRAILLRADTDAGHGIGSAEDARQAELADIYTFAWSRASR